MGLHITDQFSFHLETFLLQQAAQAEAAAGAVEEEAGTASGAGLVQRVVRARRAEHGGGDGCGATLQQMVDFIRRQPLDSDVMVRADLFPRSLSEVWVAEFFGPVACGGAGREAGYVLPEQEHGGGAAGTEADEGQQGVAEQQAIEEGDSSGSSSRQQEQLSLAELLEAAGHGATPAATRPRWQWAAIHAAERLGLAPRELQTLALCAAPLLALRWWKHWHHGEDKEPPAAVKAAVVVAAAAAAWS